MKIRTIELDISAEEIASSTVIQALVDRLGPGLTLVEVDDDVRDGEPVGPSATPNTPDSSAGVAGVPEVGQEVVKAVLLKNEAADLFRSFMETVNAWGRVEVWPITPKGKSAGAPADFSRYLRLNKSGSGYGAFAYVWPGSGTIELRLSYASDDELAAIAPRAWRYLKGNPVYSVSIKIVDEDTLGQALDLARRAYDLI